MARRTSQRRRASGVGSGGFHFGERRICDGGRPRFINTRNGQLVAPQGRQTRKTTTSEGVSERTGSWSRANHIIPFTFGIATPAPLFGRGSPHAQTATPPPGALCRYPVRSERNQREESGDMDLIGRLLLLYDLLVP